MAKRTRVQLQHTAEAAVQHVLLRAVLTGLRQTDTRIGREHQFWHSKEDLARTDWPAFVKSERESGSAMYDDPPPGWTQKDLAKWSLGYCHGRAVESGNHTNECYYLARLLARAIGPISLYGPRPGFPPTADIAWHQERTLHGVWYLAERDDKGGNMFGFLPGIAVLSVHKKNGKAIVFNRGQWRDVTPEDRKNVLTAMPVELNGTPAPWKEPERP